MKVPVLKGKRIILRPLKLKDAPNFVRWFKDREVIQHTLRQEPISMREELRFIRKVRREKNHAVLSIFNENRVHIGSTGLKLFPADRGANFGIIIGKKDEWGKGYAGEAIKAVGDYVFKKLKYNRLDLNFFTDNKRARRAYEKAGFKLEGIMRQRHWDKTKRVFRDEGVMSILREEWHS